ncbi:MAG: PQQ-binding-like beta-propeller repeat protein [Verrucomicrobiota bacterium]
MKSLYSIVAGVVLGASLAAHAADAQKNWPAWRGPTGNGVAPAADPPVEWSESNNIKWKVKIPGYGTSTPIVWENQVFILTAVNTGKKAPGAPTTAAPAPAPRAVEGQVAPGKGPGGKGGPKGRGGPGGGGNPFGVQTPTELHQFTVISYDRQTGKVLWQKVAREELPHEGHHRDHGFASASPVTDGQLLFAYFGSRGLFCYDLQGNLKWQKDFGDARMKNSFGEGTSPTLHGNTLIIKWDHDGDSFIMALDKTTGKELWRKSRDERSGWSTPLVVEHNGRAQVVVNATGKVRSYDLQSGEVLWEIGGQTDNAIPSPVSANGMVYLTSGFRGSALQAVKLAGAKGEVAGTSALVWSANRDTPYVPSPLLYDGRLYLHKGNDAYLSCFDAVSGKAHYADRIEGPRGIYASPVGAAGRVYVIGRDGTSLVLKNSDRLEVLATNKLDDKFDASAAAVGKELFLRGQQNLYCIAAK